MLDPFFHPDGLISFKFGDLLWWILFSSFGHTSWNVCSFITGFSFTVCMVVFFGPPLSYPAPALPYVGVCVFFLLLLGTGGGSYTGNFFFFLLPGTGGGSYTGNFFFFLLPGTGGGKLHRELFFLLLPGTEEEEITQGTFFSFCCQGQKRRKLHRELFFLLLPGTGGGSYTGNFFSFCCQGQKRRKLHMELFFLLTLRFLRPGRTDG